ncbi:MAG: transglutaminase-like domain-containing protein [Fimbriimonadaceae bacterium]|nr:transglutaminase-like domain-containing protein [Fimbriimonadaceae bacterium]
MAAILRAANIPTRLVSGLVYGEGAFFYHAWVEVWDGEKWIGFDSTRPNSSLSATHIKTAQGTIAEAYTGFLLEGAKIKVVEADGLSQR